MPVINSLVVFLLIFPFVFTIVTAISLRKFGFNKEKSFGYAADFTTPLFFIAIPVIFKSIWDFSIIAIFLTLTLGICIIFTYIDWRTKKEIEIPVLLKKIWRAYFLLFSSLYVIIMVVGFISWMITYMTG